MDSGQYAVVISCTDSHPRELVKLIINEDEFSKSTTLHSNITAYPWHIDTKYYTTDINICALEDKTCNSAEFTSCIEAVIIQFDSNQNDGLDIPTSWFPFIKETSPEIRILVCDRCLENPSSGVRRLDAQQWCIARGFELVELDPELNEEWEQEQDFIETTGKARIIQALHAHTWPKLRLKEKAKTLPPSLHSILVNGTPAPENTQGLASNEHGNDLAGEIRNMRVGEVDDVEDEIAFNDSFFELFQTLSEIKDYVVNLSSEERKACAEEVLKSFWTAIGGDREELSGNDSD